MTPADRHRFEPPSLDQIARLFPQLELHGLLGAGGMGAVYKARQPALDRWVALKVLPVGGGVGSPERFNREARALARLNHPNIVAVHEFGQVEGLHFFIMEFVDGANLRQLEKTSRLSPREALQIIPQICDALQYAHDEGVVHRDIKPENVLVDRRGRVKIADFGLAKIADPDPAVARLTVEGQVMGTPHYMAPEQIERPLAVDHRADIYALGVVFYEMLTGDLPLGKFAPPSRKVEVDVRLDDIVLRALENDPERRYQQASDVKSEVQTVASKPPAKPADSRLPEAAPVQAAGLPLVRDQRGQRRIVSKNVLRAWAIVLVAMGALAVTWMALRNDGLATRLAKLFGRSEYGRIQVAEREATTGTLAVRLPNGTTLELLALAHGSAGPDQWWRPDGTPLPDAAFDIRGPADMLGNDRQRTKFAFKVTGSTWAMETASHEFDPPGGISAGGQVWHDGQKVHGGWPLVAAWAHVTNQATLRFGLRFEEWRTIATFAVDGSGHTETQTLAGDPTWIVMLNHFSDNGTDTLATLVLNREMKTWRKRVVAVDKDGHEHAYSRAMNSPSDHTETWTHTFSNLTVDRIQKFLVQVQPVRWVEFRNVPLHPDRTRR